MNILEAINTQNLNLIKEINKGKRFTGAMIGMYAFVGSNKLIVPFDFFRYSETF